MINITNKKYFNIVKGIGILSIVIGHCYDRLRPYVYLYHLVIFFFVSGYLYSEEKYGDKPWNNFLARMKNNWLKYSIYCVFFVLIHNILLKLGMISDTTYYTSSKFVTASFNSIFFLCEELLTGALWFVPLLIFTSSMFGAIIYFSKCLEKRYNTILKYIFLVLVSILCGIVGVYFNQKNIYTAFHMQTSFLMIPIMVSAYYAKKYIMDLSKILKIYIFIPVCVLLYVSVKYFNIIVELSANQVPNFFVFYMVSFAGIYFCLYIAKILTNIKLKFSYFELIGKYSYEIMAFHFLVFKIIDFVYAKMNNIKIYSAFPYAFSNLWPIYIILGCTLPALLFAGINILKNKIFDLKR